MGGISSQGATARGRQVVARGLRRVSLWLLILIVVGAVGVGCARVAENRKARLLESAVEGYRQALRWGDYDAALGFVSPEARADVDLAPLANVRVVRYDVARPLVMVATDRAEQVVHIGYVRLDRQRLETLTDRQEWRYDAARAAWWLHSALPGFARPPR